MKLYLLLRRDRLEKYLDNHYMEIDPDSFVSICRRLNKLNIQYVINNPKLLTSTVVLDYLCKTLPPDSEEMYTVLSSFSNDSINDEILDIIENNLDKFPNIQDLPPKCFSRKKLCLALLTNGRSSTKYITEGLLSLDELDDDIIKALKSAVLNKSLFAKFPILFSNPDIFRNSVWFDDSILALADDEFYVQNPNIVDEYHKKIFRIKPSLIKRLTEAQIQRYDGYFPDDYFPTEEDLINYPNLTFSHSIMRRVLSNNPKMVVYLSDPYIIAHLLDIIDEIDFKTLITEEDLEKHPNLIYTLIILDDRNPFPMHCLNLKHDYEKKMKMYEYLLNHDIDGLMNMPFMREKFGASLPEDKLRELLKRIDIDTDYDIAVRKKYFATLNRVVYSVALLRYQKIKDSNGFLYNNALDLKSDVVAAFEPFTEKKFRDLVLKIQSFDTEYSIEEVERNLLRLYEIYKVKGDIKEVDTKEFFDALLKHHQDLFCKLEQGIIKSNILLHASLAEEEKRNQENNYKIKKITEALMNKDYAFLGITEEEFDKLLTAQDRTLLDNRTIKDANIVITDDMLDKIHYCFKNGRLNNDTVSKILNTDDKEIIKFVIQNYERLKQRFFDLVDTKGFIYARVGLVFDARSIEVTSRERTAKILVDIITHMDKKQLDMILQNGSSLELVKSLIPLVDLIPELNVDALINILTFSDRIVDKDPAIVDVPNGEFANIYNLIRYANGYASCDDILRHCYGEETTSILGASGASYLDTYLKMVQRRTSLIPPISLKTESFVYESANGFDSTRLTIGKRYRESCIDLHNGAGVSTYKKCLLEEDGDVIIARTREGKFFSRLLVFRVGNVIQIQDISYQVPKGDLEKIGRMMIEAAREKGDNIEYVLTPATYTFPKDFTDINFRARFPHADLNDDVSILATNSHGKIDFEYKPSVRYDIPRPPVNPHATDRELTKIRALRIEMESDPVVREDLKREFEPAFIEDYEFAIAGVDWYIAKRKDGSMESVCLPTEIAEREMAVALQEIGSKQRR